MKRGDVVKARDYKDEDWAFGIYMKKDRRQDAFLVLVFLNGRLAPHLYNEVAKA